MITIGINPVAFSIGAVSIRWYGIMVGLAVLTVILWVMREVGKGANLSYDSVFTAALVGIPSGIVMSRLLHVVDNIVIARLHPELVDHVVDYIQHPNLIIGAAGLTIYGAILGAALGIWVYSKIIKLQFGRLADLAAPGIILAQAVGRVGCTINGCCYGMPTSLPWGVVYTHPNSVAFGAGAVHPTQVYELIFCLVGSAVLARLKGRLSPEGSLFLLYLNLYALWRLGIDFLREGTPFLFGLHQAQVIALIVVVFTGPILVWRTRWVKK